MNFIQTRDLILVNPPQTASTCASGMSRYGNWQPAGSCQCSGPNAGKIFFTRTCLSINCQCSGATTAVSFKIFLPILVYLWIFNHDVLRSFKIFSDLVIIRFHEYFHTFISTKNIVLFWHSLRHTMSFSRYNFIRIKESLVKKFSRSWSKLIL